MKNIFLICGKSGTGKDTLIDIICRAYGYKKLKSYTTRKQRYKTENTHEFISMDKYKNLKNIVAETYFDGNYYCATQDQVDNSDIYIVDKKGIEDFKKNYKGNKNVVVICYVSSLISRYKRMRNRGDSIIGTIKRIYNDSKCFKGIEEYTDFNIENKYIAKTLDFTKRIIDYAERECD